MNRLTRRRALQLFGAAGTLAGCGSNGDGSPAGAPVGQEPSTPYGEPGPGASQPDPGNPGDATPAKMLAEIETIVVVMMENRSFDHYLGSLKRDPKYAAAGSVDGLTGAENNPAPNGTPISIFNLQNFTVADPPHGWDAAHAQFNAGKNDGVVKAHAGATQNEVMGFHDRAQLPFLYWLADNYTVCDRWFSSVLGPTWPNRFYLHAGTSKGKK